MEQLRLSLIQTDIAWEDKEKNLQHVNLKLDELQGQTDLVILPEMFSTGFTMNSRDLAEPITGNTITTLQKLSQKYDVALTGSYIASDNQHYFNRGFFISPENDPYFYDKRHLFRMGDEPEFFTAGQERTVIPYRGWNICLLVCYDLRFPVWSRNINNEYDLLLYVANWPEARRDVWDCLLRARAIENMSYVVGTNRIGTDGNNLKYNGGSVVISPRGELLAASTNNKEHVINVTLSLSGLSAFRKKFPVWKDSDNFNIIS